MKPRTCITTSWDDGHPLDFRVAELLTKYDLRGTFYVPRAAKTGTMAAAQLRELSSSFEVGAHTLTHAVLTRTPEGQARDEIAGSKNWVEDVTGRSCLMFCPPQGKHSSHHLALIREAGYLAARTVELLSLDFPRPAAGLLVMPTTVQAHPHRLSAYTRNIAKRFAFRNLGLYVLHGRSTGWPKLARSLLAHALQCGGVFHLWGHSWELEESGQWQRLGEVLKFLSQFIARAPALVNSQVCQAAAPQPAPVQQAVAGIGETSRAVSRQGTDVGLVADRKGPGARGCLSP
jgi:peptidoglycan/xylan/chitin deacetylase (PgdA/CDA1 family)